MSNLLQTSLGRLANLVKLSIVKLHHDKDEEEDSKLALIQIASTDV